MRHLVFVKARIDTALQDPPCLIDCVLISTRVLNGFLQQILEGILVVLLQISSKLSTQMPPL